MNLPFLKSLDADDVFISYSRADGNAYVTGLDAALSALGFACFSDKKGTDANPLPPDTLYPRIALCKTLVFLGTPGAVAKPEHIEKELRAFAVQNGTARIIAISFDREQERADWSKASWQQHVVGKSCEREKPDALTTGEPSPEVIASIKLVSRYMKSKDRLRKYRNGALAGFVILMIGALVAAGVALSLSVAASHAKTEASRAKAEAVIAAAEAARQKAEAAKQKAEASRAKAEALRQQAIGDARALANQSQSLLRRRPDELRKAIGLAIAGLAKVNSIGVFVPEADSAVRDSVALLPAPTARRLLRGTFVAAALSPDALSLAVIAPETLRIYQVRGDAAPPKEIPFPKTRILAVNNGATVAAAGQDDDSIAVVDLRTRTKKVIPNPGGYYQLKTLALSPGGRYVAAVARTDLKQDHFDTEEMSVIIWDAVTALEIYRLVEDTLKPSDVAFNARGDLAVGGAARLRSQYSGFNGRVVVWHLFEKIKDESKSHLEEADFKDPETFDIPDEVWGIAPGNDRVFATGAAVWKRDGLGTFQRASQFLPANAAGRQLTMALSSDAKEFLVLRATADRGELQRWDVTDHRDLKHTFLKKPVSFKEESAIVGSARPRFIASDPADGVVTVRDTRESKDIHVVPRPPLDPNVSYVDVSPDGQTLLAIEETDSTARARVWDVATGREITPRSLKGLSSNNGIVSGAIFSNRSAYLTVRVQHDPSDDLKDFAPEEIPEDIVTIRLTDGAVVHRFSYLNAATSIVFSPNDSFLLISTHDLVTTLVPLGTGSAKRIHNDEVVTAAAFSPDERMFVTGSENGVIQVFFTADPETELVHLRDTGKISAVAFSRNGKRIVSRSNRESSMYEDSGENNPLRVWLLDAGDVIDDAHQRLARYDSSNH